MTDHLQKRSVLLAGHKTSLALEPPFWDVLAACAREKGLPLAALISLIDAEKPLGQPLASAARLAALDYALAHFQQKCRCGLVPENAQSD